jgi:DNA-binding helix-hairpin-helix protein with protein kinase domain
MDLRNDKGQIVRLSRPLTRPGGEGQVFEIENSSTMVAKVYHQPVDAAKSAKLHYQVQSPKPVFNGVAAWPADVLVDPGNPRVVRGIVMPRMAGKEIHKLYGPADRAVEFPAVGWDFLIHVAMNCGVAFETLHEQGVLMADVNEGNVLVKEGDGRVGLIDCDSYQIRNGSGCFLCDVGVPMWTPPELQGQDFRSVQRTPNHDRFGLAIIIFRLLFMGRHPFAGIPTGRDQFEIEEAIKRCLFAFSPQTWSRGVKPPPLALPLGAVPERLRQLFERAFLQGSVAANARPTGREWALELKALLAALKRGCVDPGHKFWNGLTSCPWCEIVTEGGPNFFISVSVRLGSVNWAADFATFWATIERVVHGALMSEQVAVPAIGRATPRPMPLGRPQVPGLSAPVAPAKPAPLPRPVVAAPVLPGMPVMAPPARLPAVPLGRSESVARVCFLGTCFFGLAALLCFNLDLSAAAMGAGWGTVTCLIVAFMKAGQARVEMRQRREAERAARAEERRVAAEEHAQHMSEYEAQVEELTKKHASAVAQAEAEYRREWVKQDQEYQKAYNDYLAKQRVYDDAQRRYAEEVGVWNAEVDVRTDNDERARRGLNAAVEELEALLSAYKVHVNMAFPGLEAARQRFEKARADELAGMRVLHQRRQELQLRQFLGTQLIQNADITNIGSGRKATLNAYGIGSALDIHPGMSVPGFGEALMSNLMGWRQSCVGRFRYNPNTQLPAAEVNAVKIKHAQTRQSALAELRGGAARLDSLETRTRAEASRAKMEILSLARAHAQAIADVTACS